MRLEKELSFIYTKCLLELLKASRTLENQRTTGLVSPAPLCHGAEHVDEEGVRHRRMWRALFGKRKRGKKVQRLEIRLERMLTLRPCSAQLSKAKEPGLHGFTHS